MIAKSRSIHNDIPRLNRVAAALLYVFQYAFPKVERFERLRQANVRGICRALRERLAKEGLTKGPTVQVERRKNLTEREFTREYMNKSIPVIFDGEALNWECTKKWNMDYLADEFGDRKLSLIERHGLVERDLDPTGGQHDPMFVEQIRVRDFVDGVKQGSKKYIRFGWLTEKDEVIQDLNLSWFKRMRKSFFNPAYLAFIGGGGRTTPIHAGLTALFFVLADGEKKWTFYSAASSALLNPRRSGRDYNFSDVDINSPDLSKYPGFDLLTRYECTIKKGDVLWVPSWMWHEVETPVDSWGIRCGFANVRTFLRYPAFVFVAVFLVRPSIFPTLFRHVFGRSRGTTNSVSLFHPS